MSLKLAPEQDNFRKILRNIYNCLWSNSAKPF